MLFVYETIRDIFEWGCYLVVECYGSVECAWRCSVYGHSKNIIDACVFDSKDAIPYINFAMPQDKHTYLPGWTPELILLENNHYSGTSYGMHVRDHGMGEVAAVMRHTRNHYDYLISRIKKNGDLAVRRSISNALLPEPSLVYWTEVKKIHKNKLSIQNRVDDKTGSVDIANAFANQYSMLYSSVPCEPTCLSELLMRIKIYVRYLCQHTDFCIKHSHFVNSTQIFDVIKRLRFVKSYGIDNLCSDNFKHYTGYFFHCISVVINCMLCHGYAPISFLHAAVIPIPKNTKLNLSSTFNYRAIALSNISSKILDTIIMSLQTDYLITSKLQFWFKEHYSTIMCSTLLVETVEYYVSNNFYVYVLLIDVSKAFDRLCHSKFFDVLETYNGCPLVSR